MEHDKRTAREQIKSGFIIVAKMLASFGIAITFLAGVQMTRPPSHGVEIILGWLLIILSVVVMTTTVKFWAAGFFGFIAYGALRSLSGVLFPIAFHVSRLYAVALFSSAFIMSALGLRFISKNHAASGVDRASIVFAASCALLAFQFGDTYKAAVIFNLGNVSLVLSCWADRLAKHHRYKIHAA